MMLARAITNAVTATFPALMRDGGANALAGVTGGLSGFRAIDLITR